MVTSPSTRRAFRCCCLRGDEIEVEGVDGVDLGKPGVLDPALDGAANAAVLFTVAQAVHDCAWGEVVLGGAFDEVFHRGSRPDRKVLLAVDYTALGGLDIDDALFQYAVKRFGLKRVARDVHGRARLRTELERAKIALSTREQVEVSFDLAGDRVEVSLQRTDLEEVVEGVIQRCDGAIDVALREAGLRTQDVAHVLLVGGPTRMPIYRRHLANKFQDNARVLTRARLNPVELANEVGPLTIPPAPQEQAPSR